MTATLVPLASALAFTLGCAAIHHLRRYAQRLTLLSALIAFLVAGLYVTWVVEDGPPQVDDVVMLDETGTSVRAP